MKSNNSILSEKFQSILDPINANIKYVSELSSKKLKASYHQTTQPEKNLLELLLVSNTFTDEEIEEVLKSLIKFWNEWTKKKV